MKINVYIACFRPHEFDCQAQRKAKPKRKSGQLSSYGAPSKGAEGVRANHKMNENKLLAHRHLGLLDSELKRIMQQ